MKKIDTLKVKTLFKIVRHTLALSAVVIVVGLLLIISPTPHMENPKDVFGFSDLKRESVPQILPEIRRYSASDGEKLAFRLFESTSNRVLIFIHGSSYHGAGYIDLASAISSAGLAKVVLPNLRGHYLSGRRRGDVDYIGQYDNDIAELIKHLRQTGVNGPIVLGGHSSGAGLVVRFAGGDHAGLISNYLALSPILPTSGSLREGSSGGWALLYARRMAGLIILNIFGIHGLDALPIIEFNKPSEFWDGTETLSYSYRLNMSYHPGVRFSKNLQAMEGKALVLIGERDEAINPQSLMKIIKTEAPGLKMSIIPGLNHFEIFQNPLALGVIKDWLMNL